MPKHDLFVALEQNLMGSDTEMDKDRADSKRLFRQSVDAGCAQAQSQLGLLLLGEKSRRCLLLAMSQGRQ